MIRNPNRDGQIAVVLSIISIVLAVGAIVCAIIGANS